MVTMTAMGDCQGIVVRLMMVNCGDNDNGAGGEAVGG